MLRLGSRQTWSCTVAGKNARSAHLSISLASQRQARREDLSQLEFLAIYPSYRLYSSLPPGLTPEGRSSKVEPVFASPASKKVKVELKPGPRSSTPNTSPTDSSKPAAAAGHVAPGKSTAGHQPLGAPASVQSKVETGAKPEGSAPPSKIKIAIADIVKAAEAGALAPPPQDASRLGKLWHQAKELFRFYVRGLKQLLVHRQIVKDIQTRVREEKAQGVPSTMTWEEVHFIKTYQEDMVKLVPFLLILLILEEALPLVVLYAPFLLPSTCILSSQRARILWKRDDAQYLARQDVRRIILEAGQLSEVVGAGADAMPNDLVTGLIKMFGLSARGPAMLHRRRLEKHLAYLVGDDQLLVNESHMGSHLDLRNLRNAMSERGFLASVDEAQLRETLERRLKALGEDPTRWNHTSLEFLLKDLVESNKDVRPAPVD